MDKQHLDSLRKLLDENDRELLKLAARRIELVRDIHQEKLKTGKHVFDRTREQEVYRKAEQTAKALNLDASVAHQVIRVLVEASHNIQEEAHQGEAITAPFLQQHFLVVGGEGKMGSRFARALKERGYQVSVVDKKDSLTSEIVGAADIVMICVPMNIASTVTKEIFPLVRQDALLCDINSLKGDICSVFAQATCETLGMHPMFGPTVKSFRRQKIIVCPIRTGARSSWFQKELGRMGFEVVACDPATHDQMMGVIQVLIHFSTLVTGQALRESQIPLENTLPFTSPIYRLELATIGRLFAQSPELYAEIEMSNPAGLAMCKKFVQAAQSLEQIISSRDHTAFHGAFLDIRTYFKDFAEEAMALSDSIIESLTTEL